MLSPSTHLNLIQSSNIFFFCGSGISYDSNLPSAHEVLRRTSEIFLPSNLSDHEIKNVIDNIQPEIFYELLLKITNNYKCLTLWKCLHKKYNNSMPNISHLFIAQYSFFNKSPIITTNFDLMFEMAAELLGIDYCVLLPNQAPPMPDFNKLYICKVHGSVSDENGDFSPNTLWTTMTSITKINTPWISYIQNLMKAKNICFVGYSGRDIDYFPYIQEFSKNSKPVIWINRFDLDVYSEKKSIACNAIKINDWPSSIFHEIASSDDLYLSVKEISSKIKQSKTPVSNILKKLVKDINKLKLISNNSKIIFYINVLSALGMYNKAFDIARKIYESNINLPIEHRMLLILNFSRLNHENSKYLKCGLLAKELLVLSKSQKVDKLDIIIQARCLISESLRMNIPYDAYFPYKKDILDYIFLFYVFFHFIVTILYIKLSIFFNKKTIQDIDVAAQHEFIEHKIRFYALIQSALGSSIKGWGQFTKYLLGKIWDSLKKESYLSGYAAGIANTRKFKYRIFPEQNISSEATEIFRLTTSSTGKELMLRNFADEAIKNKEFEKAQKFFREYSDMAKLSGNKLNEIKGYMGIAHINYLQDNVPLLTIKEYDYFNFLIKNIEGKFWQKYFKSISLFIKNKG